MDNNIILNIAIYALPVIFAFTMHEAAHGYIAKLFGDFSAFNEGRCTLNPIRHIDFLGTLVVPSISFAIGKLIVGASFLIGWAKPVPQNPDSLRNPDRDPFWIALAGPGSHLIMLIFWAVIAKLGIILPHGILTSLLVNIGKAGIEINIILMLINLLPLPPMDGGYMLISLLPQNLAEQVARIEPQYGLAILIVLLLSGILNLIIQPAYLGVSKIITSFFGLYI